MAKKLYVNEVDGFFIMSHRQTLTLEQLSKKLKLETAIIRKYIDENIDTKTIAKIKGGDDALNAMGHKRESTVMTQAASEIGDTYRGKKTPMNTSHLHKIK